MRYVVFDMDQTIADISMVYFFLVSLTVITYLKDQESYLVNYFPEGLDDQLEHAYRLFVERLAKEEISSRPIGILRPGVISVMRRISKMKTSIGGVSIYSNNQYLPSIELVRDILHVAIGRPIIDVCIHWNHPLREWDHLNHPFVSKTWDVLRSILVENGVPNTIEPKDVIFFDDQHHPQLHRTLSENYYKVPIYRTTDSLDRLSSIYVSCIQDARVNVYSFFTYLLDVFSTDDDVCQYNPSNVTINNLLHMLQRMSRKESFAAHMVEAPHADHGIRIMKDAIDDIRIQYELAHPLGGKRYTYKRRRMTIKK